MAVKRVSRSQAVLAIAASLAMLAVVIVALQGGYHPLAQEDLREGSDAAEEKLEALIYASPSCSCCSAYAGYLEDRGFNVAVVHVGEGELAELKRRLGVPPGLWSCHTALAGGYVVEGHVPAEAILRLLEERPSGLAGIAVPGMPPGSPGMQGEPQPLKVYAFTGDGEAWVYGVYTP